MDIRFKGLETQTEWQWVHSRCSPKYMEDTRGIVAYDAEDMDIKAVCVFDSWTENSVQMHMAIDNPFVLRHGLLEEVAEYVYNQSGRDIILAVVPDTNKKALKLDTHIGMTLVHTVKDGYKRGVDYHLLELRRENCRWFKEKTEKVAANG